MLNENTLGAGLVVSNSVKRQSQSDKLAMMIARNHGAIGWNQDRGELYGKRRWHIILYPYDEASDHLIIFSKHAPRGVHIVMGAELAFASAKTLYGKTPSKDLLTTDDNGGLEYLTISPTGQRGRHIVAFKPDYQASDRQFGLQGLAK